MTKHGIGRVAKPIKCLVDSLCALPRCRVAALCMALLLCLWAMPHGLSTASADIVQALNEIVILADQPLLLPDGRILYTYRDGDLSMSMAKRRVIGLRCLDRNGAVLWDSPTGLGWTVYPQLMLMETGFKRMDNSAEGYIGLLMAEDEDYRLWLYDGEGHSSANMTLAEMNGYPTLMADGVVFLMDSGTTEKLSLCKIGMDGEIRRCDLPISAVMGAVISALKMEDGTALVVRCKVDERLQSEIIMMDEHWQVKWRVPAGVIEDEGLMVQAWTLNRHGGVTAYCQTSSAAGGKPAMASKLLCLDGSGGILWEKPLDSGLYCPVVNVMRQNSEGQYELYGFIEADDRRTLFELTVDDGGDTACRLAEAPGERGICVEYLDRRVYAMTINEAYTIEALVPFDDIVTRENVKDMFSIGSVH